MLPVNIMKMQLIFSSNFFSLPPSKSSSNFDCAPDAVAILWLLLFALTAQLGLLKKSADVYCEAVSMKEAQRLQQQRHTGFSNAFILCALSWAAIRIKWGNQLFALIKIYRHTARQIERQPRLQIQLQIHLQIQIQTQILEQRVSEWGRWGASFICPVTSSTCIASFGFVLFYFSCF